MKRILKKNQIIITALAIMIAIAGYINYKDMVAKNNKETKAANSSLSLGETDAASGDILSNDAEPDDFSVTDPGVAVLTGSNGADISSSISTSTIQSDFIISAKLDREQVRAANKEMLLEIINNAGLDDASKADAINQMITMTDIAEREAAAELLLEAKGFTDVIVSITDEQADVVVNRENLSDTERAQIEDIIRRKSGISVENITISAVSTSTVSTQPDSSRTQQTGEQSGRQDQRHRGRGPGLFLVQPPALEQIGQPLANGADGSAYQKRPYQILPDG